MGLAGYVLGVQGVWFLFQRLTLALGDEPSSTGSLVAATIDALLLGVFVAHHHAFATPGMKRWVSERTSLAVERSLYVGVSGALLIALIAVWQPLPGALWDLRGTHFATALQVANGLGWAGAVCAAVYLNQLALFGILGAWRELRGAAPRVERLVTRGPYARVRHPMYLGFVTACWATPHMGGGRLLLALGLTAYAWVGARFEERKLLTRYGESYRAYRRSVPACIPRTR